MKKLSQFQIYKKICQYDTNLDLFPGDADAFGDQLFLGTVWVPHVIVDAVQ